MRVEWHGLDELTTVFDVAGRASEEVVTKIVKNSAEKFKSKAKGYAPHDTYYLKNHIVTELHGTNADIISEAGYSGFQEFGTRFQPGTKYMRPAMEDIKPEFKQNLQDAIKGVFK